MPSDVGILALCRERCGRWASKVTPEPVYLRDLGRRILTISQTSIPSPAETIAQQPRRRGSCLHTRLDPCTTLNHSDASWFPASSAESPPCLLPPVLARQGEPFGLHPLSLQLLQLSSKISGSDHPLRVRMCPASDFSGSVHCLLLCFTPMPLRGPHR